MANIFDILECSPGFTTTIYSNNPSDTIYTNLVFTLSFPNNESVTTYSCVDDQIANNAHLLAEKFSQKILTDSVSGDDKKNLDALKIIVGSVQSIE